MKSYRWAALVAAGLLVGLWSGQVYGFSITNSQQIDGASPQIVGDGVGNTITPSGSQNDWTYNWADRDGDDTSNAVTTAGLTLGEYSLVSSDTSTRGTITLDLDSGNMAGSGELAIRTHRNLPESNNQNAHNLTIQNVGDLDMGGLDTSGNTYRGGYFSGSGANGGNINIGTEDNRAGVVRVAC